MQYIIAKHFGETTKALKKLILALFWCATPKFHFVFVKLGIHEIFFKLV